MKLTTCKKPQICNICKGGIEPEDEYWSAPYKSLCLSCGKKVVTGKLTYDRSKRSYVDTMDTKGQRCVKCQNTSTSMIHGKPACDDHVGIVFEEK